MTTTTTTTTTTSAPQKYIYKRSIFGTFITIWIVLNLITGFRMSCFLHNSFSSLIDTCSKAFNDETSESAFKMISAAYVWVSNFIMSCSDYSIYQYADILIKNRNSQLDIQKLLLQFTSLLNAKKLRIIGFFNSNPESLKVITLVLEYLKFDNTKFLFSLAIQAFIIIVTILKLFRCCMVNRKIRYSLTFFIIFLEIIYELCYGTAISFYLLPSRSFFYIFSFLPLTSCWARWFYPIYASRVTSKMVEQENQFDPEMQRFAPPSVLQGQQQQQQPQQMKQEKQ